MHPWIAAVDTHLGPLAAWLASEQPSSHQALADADPRVFPPHARARMLWRKAETDLDGLRQGVWEVAQKSARDATYGQSPPVEIQRSGLVHRDVLRGQLFPALLHQGLLEAAHPLPAQAHDRYYAELPEMPGDLDSAAAIALASAPSPLLPGALERLAWGLAQNPMPVWQGEGWFGPHCHGVSGRALSAAARHGIPVNPSLLDALAALRPWVQGTHYPDPVVTSVLVAQGLRDQGRAHLGLERMMASATVSDWGPLAVAKVASFMGDRLSARRREQLLVRLIQTQRWDGSWPPSPWYLVPAMHGGMTPFGSVAINTAAALRALEALRPCPLRGGPPGATR